MAIDGPVASGKSAVGAQLARRLGYRFVDTGMMYRAFTWLALERGIDPKNEVALTGLAKVAAIRLESGPPDAPESSRVWVGDVDVTDHLRSTEVGMAVSPVSRVPAVRASMVSLQRALAAGGGIVMAGRDIGTVVLHDAPLKIYLNASPEERARRRYEELRSSNKESTLQKVQDELAHRDAIDSGRDVSPLRPAEDAVVIETDGLALEQVIEHILELTPCR